MKLMTLRMVILDLQPGRHPGRALARVSVAKARIDTRGCPLARISRARLKEQRQDPQVVFACSAGSHR